MRLRAAALPPIVLAAAALAPGGCGQTASNSADKFKGRQKEVAQAVDDLRQAASKRDARKICDTLLTPDLKSRLTALARQTGRGTDCADQLKKSLQDADSLDLTVQSVQITGNRAVARVKTNVTRGPDPTDTLVLADQRGWRLSRLP